MTPQVAQTNRKARRAAAAQAKPATAELPNPPAPVGASAELPSAPEITDAQMVTILSQQVAVARNAFYRLAEVRAADLVKYEGKAWNEAGQYIEAEMRGLDGQLAQVVPPAGQS